MNRFKQTLKMIEEGLLAPMSSNDVKEVEANRKKEWIKEFLSNDVLIQALLKAESNVRFSAKYVEPDGSRIYDAIKKTAFELKFKHIPSVLDLNELMNENARELFDEIIEDQHTSSFSLDERNDTFADVVIPNILANVSICGFDGDDFDHLIVLDKQEFVKWMSEQKKVVK